MRRNHTGRKPLLRISAILLAAVMLLSGTAFETAFKANAATLSDINSSSVFLKQSTSGTCTLTAVTMMLRRTALALGNTNWSKITASTVKPYAWINGVGIYNNFSYGRIYVKSAYLPGGAKNVNYLIKLLRLHPEGVVIYDYNSPHAVLLTDYTNGVFYCADPAKGYPSGRIPLSRACDVTALNADKFWYVASPDVSVSGASAQAAVYVTGTYTVTASGLNLRSHANTLGTVYTVIKQGESVVVRKIYGSWGYVTYNGYSGWICLNYASYAPNAVTGFKLVGSTSDSVSLSWSKQTAVQGYQIYNCVTGEITAVIGADNVKYTVSSLIENKAYNFRIRSYNTVSKKLYFSPWSYVLKTATAPAASKVNVQAEDISSSVAQWAKNTKVTGNVQYSVSSI